MHLESEIRNGHPWSVGAVCGWKTEGEDARLFDELESEEQSTVLQWIADNLLKTQKTPNLHHSSYGLKHLLERDTSIYMTNNQFKDAMLIAGFGPVKVNEINWHYCISRKSPAFKKKVWH